MPAREMPTTRFQTASLANVVRYFADAYTAQGKPTRLVNWWVDTNKQEVIFELSIEDCEDEPTPVYEAA